MYKIELDIKVSRQTHSNRNSLETVAARLKDLADDLERLAMMSYVPTWPYKVSQYSMTTSDNLEMTVTGYEFDNTEEAE